MKNILITGATGNIGVEVIHYLYKLNTPNQIIAAARNIEKAKKLFDYYESLKYTQFDFENPDSFDSALENIDIVFLLRPPNIADIEKFFKPLISQIQKKRIDKIVFLSVQGVEKSSIIPHNQIEKLIIENQISYVFLRPSYFMQNLTTTLSKDILTKKQIVLPAGEAKFNWVDVKNIGELAAVILDNFEQYKNSKI